MNRTRRLRLIAAKIEILDAEAISAADAAKSKSAGPLPRLRRARLQHRPMRMVPKT